MKIRKAFLSCWFIFLFLHLAFAQEKSNLKFGKISADDFNFPIQKFDSGANAVIIADIGNTKFEGNNKGFFTLVYTRFMRVKIINKKGFDIGDNEISLYRGLDGDAERLSSIHGSTYNFENGQIIETKLEEKSIFSEKFNKNIEVKKFSMPGLKEGSVFDLEYTIRSPYESELRPWSFQGNYPVIWSEYEAVIAFPFHYMLQTNGDVNFDIHTAKSVFNSYTIREDNGTDKDDIYDASGNDIDQRWVKKNVPALHEEPYTTTLDNYYSKISFQLAYFQWSANSERHNHMNTWFKLSKELMDDEEFGHTLAWENGWMSDELKNIISDSKSDEEKARKIYTYVRDNFKMTQPGRLFMHNTLKDVFKKREGSVAEINLLLTAMLIKAELKADPMILSTRDNGLTSPEYPMIEQYNYVICVVHLYRKDVILDASSRFSDFGMLTKDCYNGYARTVNEINPFVIMLSPDSISETDMTSVIVVNDEKKKISGSFTDVLGKSSSYDKRAEIASASIKDIEKEIVKTNSATMVISNFGIDSLNKYEFPLAVHYDFDLLNFNSEIIYFNPMFGEGYNKNPFTSMERHYPVEMPYKINETYVLNMEIPEGYKVDEIPKSARVNYNDNEGFFEYLIQAGETSIQMRVRLQLNKAYFPTEEYTTLRDFFGYVVKKESEQVVFKKAK